MTIFDCTALNLCVFMLLALLLSIEMPLDAICLGISLISAKSIGLGSAYFGVVGSLTLSSVAPLREVDL